MRLGDLIPRAHNQDAGMRPTGSRLIILSRPPTGATWGKAAPDPVMARRAVAMMEDLPTAGYGRPVRMLTVRPEGLFETVAFNGDEHLLSETEFHEGLGRLFSVASEAGWNVYGFRYNWERGEPVAHFGYVTTEVVGKRPDVVRWRNGRPAMLNYEALGANDLWLGLPPKGRVN